MHDVQPHGVAVTPNLKVQTYACTVGVCPDWNVVVASDNCKDILNVSPEDLLGRPMAEIFDQLLVHRLRSQAQLLSVEAPVLHLQGCKDEQAELYYDITITSHGEDVFFEFEPAEITPGLATGLEQIQRMVHRVASRTEIEDASMLAARTLKVLTGFERVSVHRSSAKGFGTALGIETVASLPGEPSADCVRAHAENASSMLHYIPDLDQAISPLQTRDGDTTRTQAGAKSLCSIAPDDRLRAALKEEGVKAAMTIPVWIGEELWGLFICHSTTPRSQSVGRRSALALYALLFGYEVKLLYERTGAAGRSYARSMRNKIISLLDQDKDFGQAVLQNRDDINAILPHDGLALWHMGGFTREGQSLPLIEFESLFSYMQTLDIAEVITIDRLSDINVASSHLDPKCTALMAIPISLTARDYLLLFRQIDPVNDRKRNWLPWEIDSGNALRAALIEAHLKLVEKTPNSAAMAQDQNGLLVAELNHRVRNTLNLIRGMISQGRSKTEDVDTYAAELEGRVFALARAHDQLTKLEWGWVNLATVVDLNMFEYVRATRPNVVVQGTEIDLSPTAFTTLALVLHELSTNSQKFGALSSASGQVSLSVEIRPDRFAALRWVESDGPVVVPPDKKGFGLTIIEQSVPFELRGFAELEFKPEGLAAEFLLPPAHLRPHAQVGTVPKAELPRSVADTMGIRIDGDAMIVEDSLIIAIEAAELLRDAGATNVYSCNSVENALKTLDEAQIAFAMVDINLGGETSLEVANVLWERGIPAVLATGYGRDQAMLKKFPAMPLLTKPYGVEDLKQAMLDLGRDGGKP